jgi:phosphohistidine swiveling domain-containing protein
MPEGRSLEFLSSAVHNSIEEGKMTEVLEEGRKVILQGLGASGGVAQGRAKVITDPQVDRVEPDDIIVAAMTDPGMIVAMSKSAAIVTDSGGMTCHAAIIARELGKPCVVGTQSATEILKDGMRIEIDGTRGLVMLLEEGSESQGEEKVYQARAFRVFGNLVEPVRLKMNRDKPIWTQNWQNWQEEWTDAKIGKQYEWVSPRPEIKEFPLRISLSIQGMEKMPHIFSFNIGPLYTRFYNCALYWRFDKLRQVFALLSDKLLRRDEQFIAWFKQELYQSYSDLDEASEELKHYHMGEIPLEGLLNLFGNWWRAHERFFSLCLFIQSMGDDIVWPRIQEILLELYSNEKVDNLLSILSLPTEKVLSTEFYDASMELVANAPREVKDFLFSTPIEREALRMIEKLDGEQEWLKSLKDFTQKWGWMRDRDLYFEPIGNELGALEFIRRHASPNAQHTSIENNATEIERCLRDIERRSPKEKFEELTFFLNLGKFLQKERDDHHVMWLRNSSVIRELFLEVAARLAQSNLLETEKDIFFLFVPEIYKLVSPETPSGEKRQIVEKIPRRMTALTFTSKIKLHQRKGYNPELTEGLEHDEEYF